MAAQRIGGIVQVEKSILQLTVSDRALNPSKGGRCL